MLKGGAPQEEYKAPKAFLYQMYFVIGRLDAAKLAKMDFIINFGVSVEQRNKVLELIEYGGDYGRAARTFDSIPFEQLLKMYKYFHWADSRLHTMFYHEKKDEISEDLLNDFKDPEN